jgi:DNA-binding SARP family transcriptional activator
MSKYTQAYILEEKEELNKAINLYTEVIKISEELSFKKLEIDSAIRIIKNRLKIYELMPSVEEILNLKKKIPEYLGRESIEINLILAELYSRKYKQKKKESLLDEALELSNKARDMYCLSKTCYMLSKISSRNKDERENMKKKAEECLEKLDMRDKRELKRFFKEMDEKTGDVYLVKTRDKEFTVDCFELEKVRNKKNGYDLFIDIPGKYVFEKVKSEISIFRRTKVLSLLLFLIHNHGDEFTLEEIHNEIWEWKYEGEVSGIEVRKCISRLRKLIEPDKNNFKYILLREGVLGQKNKYFFNYETDFCLITEGA